MAKNLEEYLSKYLPLTSGDLDFLSQFIEIRSFDKKVKLIELGEVDQYLNFVMKGLVRKYFVKGKEQIVKHIAKEGTILSSSVSFFYKEPSKFVLETIEPTVLASISNDNLEKLYQSDNKWEKLGRLMMADFLIEKEYLLLDSIRFSPRERFLRFMKEEPDLLQRVPQKYLASYLEIKPETFSRLKHLMFLKPSLS
jgi:CRP-like cAMP-binding protein